MSVVGSLALERFRLEDELGSGAYGTVSRAWDTRLRREVAIKAIRLNGEGSDRVMREAHAAARLSHTGIVTLYEVGIEDGVAYLVTELVEGPDLREALDSGWLSDRDIAELGADLCEALDHAHSRGVVHRDLKPANILVADVDGRAKLMDFGVARLTDEAGLTATGDVVGTLAYMSPEQAEGMEVGAETDVFTLGLVLYEAFCGENPNRRSTPVATVRAIGSDPPPLSSRRPDLPQALTDAIDGALDVDPELRPDLEQLGRALESSFDWLDRRAPEPRRGLPAATFLEVRDRLQWLPARALLWIVLLCGMAVAVFPAASPGIAALIAACLLPVALFARSGGPAVFLPLVAPALGLVALGPLYPALCGLARNWRDRAVIAASGLLVAVAFQVTSSRDLGLGPLPAASSGWEASVPSALSALFSPFVGEPRLLATVGIWVTAALLVGILVAPLRAWTGGQGFSRRMNDDLSTDSDRSRTRSIRSR